MSAKRLIAASLMLASVCVLAASCYYVLRQPHEHAPHDPRLVALERTLLTVSGQERLHLPALVAADGKTVASDLLLGRWSVVFLGFASCPDVCPTTLQLLGAVARDPASGVAAGTTQILFVSIDPERDTPERMRAYLERFGGGILGLTGSREAIDGFTTELGGAYRASASGIDHSTSLFVVDPKGHPAGILLRPADPARIVADLAALRAGG